MMRWQLLAQKTPLTVYEAAQLLSRIHGGSAAEVSVSVLVDAIKANELASVTKRWPRHPANLGVTLSDGDIDPMETTVQRSDLDAWLKARGLAVTLPVVANLEFAKIVHAEKQRTAATQGKLRADDAMTSDTTARRQSVWAAALGQVETARIKYLADNSGIIMHRLTGTRTSALLAVIALAKKTAVDAADYQSVWTALLKLAASDTPPPPLLGQVERGESIQYMEGSRVKRISKSALSDMMSRAVTKAEK